MGRGSGAELGVGAAEEVVEPVEENEVEREAFFQKNNDVVETPPHTSSSATVDDDTSDAGHCSLAPSDVEAKKLLKRT